MTGVWTDDVGFVQHTRPALAKARCTHATPHPVTGISDSGSAGASPSQSMDSSTLELPPCGIGVSVSHNLARGFSEEATDGDERLTRFPGSTYENPSALFAALRETIPWHSVLE